MLAAGRASAAEFPMRQYHNQPVESPLHKRLTQMWDAVKAETHGRVQVEIFPENNHFKDGDPDPLELLVRGELDFLTLAATASRDSCRRPTYKPRRSPFGPRPSIRRHRRRSGGLPARRIAPKGVHLLPRGCFENGFHQITCATRPIRNADDLKGLKIRAPGNAVYLEFWKTLGAIPMGMNINKMHDALKNSVVEAQEDPFDVAELFHLYEVQKYMSVTNHSWSGYNQLASIKSWERLPADIRRSIERNTMKFVSLQRADTASLNQELRARLTQQGMIFNDADVASFRAKLGPFYAHRNDPSAIEASVRSSKGAVGKFGLKQGLSFRPIVSVGVEVAPLDHAHQICRF